MIPIAALRVTRRLQKFHAISDAIVWIPAVAGCAIVFSTRQREIAVDSDGANAPP